MFRDEFRLRHFTLWHPTHHEFTESKWLPMPVLVLYRLIITAYNLGWLTYNIYSKGAKFFIYITNWSYTLFVLYFAFATIICCIEKCKELKKEVGTASDRNDKETSESEDGIEMKIYDVDDDPAMGAHERDALRLEHKLLWLMHTISATGGLWVTVWYWSVLLEDGKVNSNNITKEALNSVFMLVDTCLSSIPVRLGHWLYALLYFGVYLLFSVFYRLLGGTNSQGEPYIYSILNYDNFKAKIGGLLVVCLLLGLPLLHLFVFGVTKLRDYLHKKYNDTKTMPYRGIYRMISINP